MNDLRALLGRLEDALEHVSVEREGATAIAKEAQKMGHVPAAATKALAVSKMEATKAQAWLRTFDACRVALGLDAQSDFEDAVKIPASAKHHHQEARA